MPRSNDPKTPLLVQDALLDDTGKLGIVRATFEGFEKSSFEDLISGYSSLKVLTYSSSVPIINRAAEKMENLEVVFGRADILGEMGSYLYPDESAEDIERLRELHVEMDRAVADACGWDDLDLGHGFHETKQGLRFTISEEARREVLDRLLLLNHERYAEEVAQGLHDKKAKKGKKRTKPKTDGGTDSLLSSEDGA
jgi:hypothetical protein